MVFVFEFVYIVGYVDRFLYIKTSLHPWNEDYLVMMDDRLEFFFNSVCKDFIEYFCINIDKGIWSMLILGFLCGLIISVIVTS